MPYGIAVTLLHVVFLILPFRCA